MSQLIFTWYLPFWLKHLSYYLRQPAKQSQGYFHALQKAATDHQLLFPQLFRQCTHGTSSSFSSGKSPSQAHIQNHNLLYPHPLPQLLLINNILKKNHSTLNSKIPRTNLHTTKAKQQQGSDIHQTIFCKRWQLLFFCLSQIIQGDKQNSHCINHLVDLKTTRGLQQPLHLQTTESPQT